MTRNPRQSTFTPQLGRHHSKENVKKHLDAHWRTTKGDEK